MSPRALTYIVEDLGRDGGPEVVPRLLEYSRVESPLTREGAVLGLAYHLDVPEALERMSEMSKNDPSPGVRAAASEALEDVEAASTEPSEGGTP